MSEAKRSHSLFQNPPHAGRIIMRIAQPPAPPASAPCDETRRVVEPWELRAAAAGGDPYNGIGAHATRGLRPRR